MRDSFVYGATIRSVPLPALGVAMPASRSGGTKPFAPILRRATVGDKQRAVIRQQTGFSKVVVKTVHDENKAKRELKFAETARQFENFNNYFILPFTFGEVTTLASQAGESDAFDKFQNGTLDQQLFEQHISEAITFLHGTMRWLHRDIKLENIVYVDERYKLIDFDMSRPIGLPAIGTWDWCGTISYLGPRFEDRQRTIELENTGWYDKWAFETCKYCLQTGVVPFMTHPQHHSWNDRVSEKFQALQENQLDEKYVGFRDLLQQVHNKNDLRFMRYSVKQ